MEVNKSSFLCFCSDNNKLTKSQFSQMLKELSELKIERNTLEKALIEQGIFQFSNMGPLPSKKLKLGLDLYLIPPKKQVTSIISDLKKDFPEEKKQNAKVFKRIRTHVDTEYSLSMSMRLDPIDEESFGPVDFAQKPSIVEKILLAIANTMTEKVPIKECAVFQFKSENNKLSGGLALPTKLPLKENLRSRTGEASIHGITLHFEKSPIGLNEVSFSLRDNKIKIKIISINLIPISKETLKETYDHSLRIAKLFFD